MRPGSLPPILQATFEQSTKSSSQYVQLFEELSLNVRSCATGLQPERGSEPSWYEPDFSTEFQSKKVQGEDIRKAVLLALDLRQQLSVSGPFALKCVGLFIEGDIDLSKLDIPFSIRLVCCQINGALILDRASVSTLDLSGSVFKNGISASYINVKGAFRGRRLVSSGPVDFGGANVAGACDLTDSVVFPVEKPSRLTAYVADRSMLNFSLATLGKDFRFARARLYGGINLRGAEIHGMLFMSDAVIRCPLAYLELLLDEAAGAAGHVRLAERRKNSTSFTAARASMHADEDIAKILHSITDKTTSVADSFTIRAETLGGASVADRLNASDNPLIAILLDEERQVAESAIRAEGLNIGGSLHGNGMRISGRVRLKALKSGAGVSFNGSSFRTARSIKADIVALTKDLKRVDHPSLERILIWAEQASSESVVAFRKEWALDLRDAKISGPLDLSHDPRRYGGGTPGKPKPTRRNRDEILLKAIIKELWKTGEDPWKFRSLLNREKDETVRKKRTVRKKDLDDFLRFPIDINHDPEHYEFEKQEEELELAASNGVPGSSKDLMLHRATFPPPLSKITPELKVGLLNKLAKVSVLNSTIFQGEIRLVNADINGSLVCKGLIANVIPDHSGAPRRRFLDMKNIKISGDADFSNSFGIDSINAKQAHIAGSVKFSVKPRYDGNRYRYQPIHQRAFFPKRDEDNKPPVPPKLRSLNFERAVIGRDAVFLFDIDNGPNIYLNSASIGAKLLILPAKFGLQLNSKDLANRANRREIPPEPGKTFFFRSLLTALSLQRVFKEHFEAHLLERAKKVSKLPKSIDLRGARADEFTHPASAWPEQDGLLVSGFTYNRTSNLGPFLDPKNSWPDIFYRIEKHQNDVPSHRWAWLVALITITVIVTFYVSPVTVFDYFPGRENTVLIILSCSALVLTYVVGNHTFGIKRSCQSMAVRWLSLQRRHFTPNRLLGSSVPYEPYLRAANSLRSEGHSEEANAVELARLRRRCRDLSWRKNFLERAVMTILNSYIGYGFRPVRATFITIIYFLCTSTIFQYAYQEGILVPIQRYSQSTEQNNFLNIINNASGDKSDLDSELNGSTPFNSVFYTVDMLLPINPVDREVDWVFKVPAQSPADQQTMRRGAACLTPVIPTAAFLLRIVGWALITLLALAIVARLETLYARARID